MERQRKNIVVIGGGPAGLAAAAAAKEAGEDSILILERDGELGGILNQCIHNGFGLHTFKEELTGPEYAGRYIHKVKEYGIPYMLDTVVTDIRPENGEKIVTVVNGEKGLLEIAAKSVVLAMGCRERPRGALNLPGYRPAGIYSAGTAQRYVNIDGRMPGREVVILGSGDIGLIMARRMTLEGARVKCVAELMPYSGGLKRNIVQCLDDFGIPLLLSTTVVDIKGHDRVEGVTLAKVDANGRPIPGTEQEIACDTLLLSCGLIPQNELSVGLGVTINPVTGGPVVNESLETSVPGVFACGNVLHVHDLVDYVSGEASQAGKCAAAYAAALDGAEATEAETAKAKTAEAEAETAKAKAALAEATSADGEKGRVAQGREIVIKGEGGVRYTVPSLIRPAPMEALQVVRFRVGSVFKDVTLAVYFDGECISRQKKRVMAPGEMEQVILKRADLMSRPEVTGIIIRVEKEEGDCIA